MKVIVRTVTNYYVGEVVDKPEDVPGLAGHFITLRSCSWIADTGRWNVALATGKLNEVEPYPPADEVRISVGAIVDVAPWGHDLPTSAK